MRKIAEYYFDICGTFIARGFDGVCGLEWRGVVRGEQLKKLLSSFKTATYYSWI
jgi:hypothetical protein